MDPSGMYSDVECYNDCDIMRQRMLNAGVNQGVADMSWNKCFRCCAECPDPSCAGSIAFTPPGQMQPVPPSPPSLWSTIVDFIISFF